MVLGLGAVARAGERRAEDYVLEVTLTKPVTLPVVVGDRQAGTAKLDAGKPLEVVDIAGDTVLVEAMGAVSPVPRDATDLAERMKAADTSGPTRRDLRDALKHGFALVGMTPGQVTRAIGPPQRQEKAGGTMRWWYPIIGDVPRVNTMTIQRSTPETAPHIIPGDTGCSAGAMAPTTPSASRPSSTRAFSGSRTKSGRRPPRRPSSGKNC